MEVELVKVTGNVCEVYPELDLGELLYEIGEEIGIKIPDEDMKGMDEMFDATVGYVASQRLPTS
jgi:hypothetical protein